MSRIKNLCEDEVFKDIPIDWSLTNIIHYINILPGFPFDSEFFDIKEGMPLIRIRDLLLHEIQTYYKGTYDSKYIIKKGNVLIGMDGDFNIVLWKGSDALLNQRILKIETKDANKFNLYFIYYQLIDILKKINNLTPQTTVKHLSIYDIKEIYLPMPKTKEQHKIAYILQTIDNTIEKTKEVIEKNKMIKQGLMNDLLTPKEDWVKESLGSATLVVSGSTPSTNNPKYWNGEITWITPDDFKDQKTRYMNSSMRKISDKGLKHSSRSMIPKESIVMSSRAPIGYLAIMKVDFCTNQGCKSFICKNKIDNEFLYYNLLFNIEKIKSKGEGTTFSEISKTQLEKFEIYYPKSISEQKEIAMKISSCENVIVSEQSYLEKISKVKFGLMQDLLTGKFRVAS